MCGCRSMARCLYLSTDSRRPWECTVRSMSQREAHMPDGVTGELLEAQLTQRADGTAILHLTGEIDLSSVETLSNQFLAISSQELKNVVLDATEVSFIDSTGLHALTEGKRLIHEQGTQIFLVPSPQVKRVLELVFPEPLFAARVGSVEEALNQIRLQTSAEA